METQNRPRNDEDDECFGQVTRRTDRAEEGFTLIELLIVMSVMLILMTLAVPQLLKLTKQAQETSAIQSVRTIGQAELQYNSAYPANGFACSLAALGGDPKSGAPTAQACAAD